VQGNSAALSDWLQMMLPTPSFEPPNLATMKSKPPSDAAPGKTTSPSAAASASAYSAKAAVQSAQGSAKRGPPLLSASVSAAGAAPDDSARAREDVELLKCVDGVAGGDETALAKLYDATVSRVYGVALRIVRQPESAEEVVTDVYMQVWKDAARYDASRGRVIAWLLIIARSRSLDFLRRADEAFSHPEPLTLISEVEDNGSSPPDLLAATRDTSALHQALQVLTPMQRQLLSLAFFKGLSHSEIVEHAGIPLGSVKTHIRRALAELRKTLEIDPAFTR
jgi:RNA polymerase sigma factor (sigma-70 family)